MNHLDLEKRRPTIAIPVRPQRQRGNREIVELKAPGGVPLEISNSAATPILWRQAETLG